MDCRQRQWSGLGWALVAGCLAFAICCGMTATVAESKRFTPRPASTQAATRVVPKACLTELFAYLKVADVARDLGSDRDILTFALDDLQAGLVDCLTQEHGADGRDAVDESGWPWQQAEQARRAA